MIISGGFNLYPSDLEAVLREHPDVAEAAVVGVPSERWGETPAAWVVARDGAMLDAEAVALRWANERLGKTQRIAFLRVVDELPRSAIGKVLKRELRDRFVAERAEPSSGASRWPTLATRPTLARRERPEGLAALARHDDVRRPDRTKPKPAASSPPRATPASTPSTPPTPTPAANPSGSPGA